MRFFLVLTASIVMHIVGNEHEHVQHKLHFQNKRYKIKQSKILVKAEEFPDEQILSIQNQSTIGQRIVGGEPAPKGRYPYLVTLMSSGFFTCGGALIENSIVLSAAHCVDIVDHVLIGHYDMNTWQDDDDAQYIRVLQKIVAPSWDKISFDNDIMLLVLDNQIEVNHNIVNINGLGKNFDYEEKDSKLTVMGYGATSEGGNTSNIPLEIEVKLVAQDQCNEAYEGKVGDSQFCAADENKDSCQGDSGGPIIVKGSNATDDLVVGVISWGTGCANPEYPGVYSKFSYNEGPNNFEQLSDYIGECILPAELQDSNCEVQDKYRCLVGDGVCDHIYNTSSCNFDAGDCVGFPDDGFDYTDCSVAIPEWIGDDFCDGENYDTPACNFDGQDCFFAIDDFPDDNFNYVNCIVDFPPWIGDDFCDGGDYNTPNCNFDGQDCVGFPDDGFNYTDCNVGFPEWIGDDFCDGADYDTPTCNFDGQDCSIAISPAPNPDPTTPTPTTTPSGTPLAEPTTTPSEIPLTEPNTTTFETPVVEPTTTPSGTPLAEPNTTTFETPVADPTTTPSETPLAEPTTTPSEIPLTDPTTTPSEIPVAEPTTTPSEIPFTEPNTTPSEIPVAEPNTTTFETPVTEPTTTPSKTPLTDPTTTPSEIPLTEPTNGPTITSSETPSDNPTLNTFVTPSDMPTPFITPLCRYTKGLKLFLGL